MKVYLVGGAVRDQLLGYPVKERDWVVVGGTPERLLQQGFSQVGKDFPVFLHPKTREEYALARTERKSSVGYYGFTCDFNPEVSLEEDLMRRDLTINAMAMDEDGTLIDPYHGLEDLNARIFRHVSNAFIEDPVRVLRIARFAARYHHLGFKLAEETHALILEMVRRGELSHLVPERVWQEFCRSLVEKNPEQFVTVLRSSGALRVVLPELDALFGIPNSPEVFVAVDSGLQALFALQKTARLTDSSIMRFAALLHNIGNCDTPIANWPIHQPSAEQVRIRIEKMGNRLRIPNEYCHLACITAQFYREIQRLQELDAEAIVQLLEHCDAFRRPQFVEQLVFISDAIAHLSSQRHAIEWQHIRENCGKISTKSLIDEGYQGVAIKNGLHQKRVHNVEAWISHEKKQ
jgi:tRNA nucleotidyltransferase (CCA-adding enzyme)